MDAVEKLNGFRPWLEERIKGQGEAVAALDGCFARGELGLTDPDFVRGAFLFAGPTGVGKTESTLCATEYFFGRSALAKMNMSEFKEAASAAVLRERLTLAATNGCRVFLLDELEKAHWEVLDLLLQVLDKGAELTGLTGQPVSFTNHYFVLTTNLGAKEAMRSKTRNYQMYARTIEEFVRRYMRPEILGRVLGLNGVVVFRRLEEPQQRELARYHLRKILERLESLQHGPFNVTDDAFEYFMRNGFSEEYGARNLIGLMRAKIEGAVADALRLRRSPAGDLVARRDGQGLEIRDGRIATAA